jgi:rhodanese-related sulfurtransferase
VENLAPLRERWRASWKDANPSIILDVRTRSQYERDRTQIPGSVRVPTDRIGDWAKRLIAENPDGEPFVRPVATYCT